MHPELLTNAIFLRYYSQWQLDPTSILFAPIAEYLIAYGLYEEAIIICRQGLENNADLVMGQVAMAKAYYRKKDFHHAREILRKVLLVQPDQAKGQELMGLMDQAEALPAPVKKASHTESPPPMLSPKPDRKTASWQTVTMAKIFAAQGHAEKAKEVYQAILKREPKNEDALSGLKNLKAGV